MLAEGSIIGNQYKVSTKLGKGAVGEVFLCQNQSGQNYAIKAVNTARVSSEVIDRLKLEYDLMSHLSHENIVKGIDLIQSDGILYLIMEYMEGGTLSNLQEELTVKQLFTIAVDVLKGLELIHSKGIVHRDLKPANILLTKDLVAKLSDFGIALANPQSALTLDGFMVGTPRYLPPEYIETGSSDLRGDLYTLGVILWERLAGDKPMTQTQKILPVTVNMLKVPDTIPAELRQVIEKATKRSVTSRYQTASEMLRDIEANIPKIRENLLQKLNFILK